MIAEGRERGLLGVRSCDEDTIEEPTESLNSIERSPHQHHVDNNSNLGLGIHHRDLSQHHQHPLDNSNDPANIIFPHHQQHIQPHRDLNGNTSSNDVNHILGSDILQQHLLTNNALNSLNLLHQQTQQYPPPHQQQQQPPHFPYHHEQDSSEEGENDDIVETTSELQHDVSIVDIGGLPQHPQDIAPISEHDHHNHHIDPSRLAHQQHEAIVYDQEQEVPQSSVDQTQTSIELSTPVFPPRDSPPMPTKKNSNLIPSGNHETTLRSSKFYDEDSIHASKSTENKRQLTKNASRTNTQGEKVRESTGIVSFKKPRRRYDNNFKLEVLEHLERSHNKLSDVARRHGIPENTLREWTKDKNFQKIKTAQSKNSGQLKANMNDPLKRLTATLMVFFEHNRLQPDHLRQSITTKLIVAKGLEARNNLLSRHKTHPFLELKEKQALESFSGSDSWAKKFAKRRDLKMTGARIKELSEDDVNDIHHSLKQISNRVKQAGPAYDDAATMIRRAAQKLLLASSVAHSTASTRFLGNIALNKSRNDNEELQAFRSQAQDSHHHQESNVQASKMQPDQLAQTHILRDAVTATTSDHYPLSP